MERSLAKLLKDLKTRPATPDEVGRLVEEIETQDKQSKIEALRARIKALQG